MENLPTLRQLQYLQALAEHRNFHAAAEACNVTQSTLSGGVRDMEDILRAPVIDRTKRRIVRFTPLGEELIEKSRPMIAQMEDITYRARRASAPLSWPLRMGVIPTVAPYTLPKILKPLQERLPALELYVHELRSHQIVEKLHDGTLDFALMAFPYDTKGLAEQTLFEEEFFCAAPPGYFPKNAKIHLRDLRGEKLLLLEDGHCLRDHALDACRLESVKEMKTLSAASLSTLIQLVHTGYGITLLPAMVANDNPMLP
ncbi:MAG TPA: LysR substrate-binding domain-containing protein, partial [Micavibrio sp.]|nr:LysR substrate-binding domain-containing protein [Micavibrio sp.]